MPARRSWPPQRALAAFACLLVALSLGCTSNPLTEVQATAEPPPELVAALTDGLVSRKGVVRVRFVSDAVGADAVDVPLKDSPFRFEPALEGTTRWRSQQEIEFMPTDLSPGTAYRAVFDLPKVLADKPEAKPFAFSFTVVTQDYRDVPTGLQAAGDDGARQEFRGSIELSDVADPAAVEKMLTARHLDDKLSIAWTHPEQSGEGLGDGSNVHAFVVSGIQRTETASSLTLSFDGEAIGVSRSQDAVVPIPGLNDFLVSSVTAQTTGERFVEIRFSDPLDKKQDLRGLIRVEGRSDLRIVKEGSVVRVYASGPWSGTETVRIASVRSARGYALLAEKTVTLSFEPLKPGVRFVGEGVLLPTTSSLAVPLEVANVRAITVQAYQVYEDNVPQFLQVNGIDGDQELRRVGKVVWSKRLPVDGTDAAPNKWTRVGLDVSELVKRHPTGLYRLRVSFERADIQWECGSVSTSRKVPREEQPWYQTGGDSSLWDSFEDLEDDGGWSWGRREDPCSSSYYADYSWNPSPAVAGRNVIVSDIGLLARMGSDHAVEVVATDLRSATPLPGAELTLLDFQLQPLAAQKSDGDGRARLATKDPHPFAVVAKANGQTSWLRLDRSEANSVAHFDVSGAQVAKGLKGFLYGERGIWRPGDTMHLTFVLFDAAGRVPAQHPVDFVLKNPRGQVVDTRTIPSSSGGFYTIPVTTAADAPTGRYQATVHAGGAKFESTLRVETVIPNRLKIDMALPKEGVRAPNLSLASTLTSRWLHGAKAPGLRADVEIQLSPRSTTFPKYADYSFDDPAQTFSSEPEEVWSGLLDENGVAAVSGSFTAPPSPGKLTGTLRTRVYEPGGAASVDETTVEVSPYERYIGLALPKGDKARNMLLTDTPHKVRIVTVDADGKPTGSGKVKLSIREVKWRWWWEQGEDNLAEYAGTESRAAVAEGEVNLSNGTASWEFQVRYPAWGRYLVTATDVESGHSTGQLVYIDWPGWAGRAQKDQPGGASVLSVTATNDKVEVGQPLVVQFPMGPGARALVSLENGSKVVHTAWVQADGDSGTARFETTATADMAPNVYARVTVLQPHQTLANDAPMRLYGIVGVSVHDPATKLEPKIATAAQFRPESKATISVSEAKGRAMTYTLAMVDEGLLGLTRFKTPNPWDTFYAREALGVVAWDLFDSVIGAYGGTLEQMLAIGGDGEAELNKRPKAQRFKPVVWYGGPYRLDAGETEKIEVPLPPYVGEVRVMVVAGEGAAFGSAETSVPVRAPLMALATMPRVLGPGEELALPVSIFAMEPSVKDVKITAEVSGPIQLVDGGARALKFKEPGDAVATFRLKVADELGIAKVKVRATSGNEVAEQVIEVDVRHPGAPTTNVLATTVEAGRSWEKDLALVGIPGSNELTLEIGRVPPLTLGRRLSELVNYPYGCAEQTTSAAFPQVALTRVLELPKAQQDEVNGNVRAGIERLRVFQNPDGGFGYWPGERGNDWSTSWIGHFLLEAERAGHALPSGMRSGWVKYQRERANRWVWAGPESTHEQAYRLYTLALAGSPDVGAMNRLRESTMNDVARWRLAAAWSLAGQPKAAQDLVAKAKLTVPAYRELSGTFGSDVRDRAVILDALLLLGDQARAMPMALELSKVLESDAGLSTQETAWALVALSRYAEKVGGSGETSFAWTFGTGAKTTVTTQRPLTSVRIPVGTATRGRLLVESASSGPLFVRAVSRGLRPADDVTEVAQGLSLTVSYASPEGSPLSPTSLVQGQSAVATVTVTNTSGRKLEELALAHVLPSGWEVGGLSPGRGEGYDYRDVRDDRVYTFFDLEPGKSLEVRVPVLASYLGRFRLPAVSVGSMYDPSLLARVPGGWADVITETWD